MAKTISFPDIPSQNAVATTKGIVFPKIQVQNQTDTCLVSKNFNKKYGYNATHWEDAWRSGKLQCIKANKNLEIVSNALQRKRKIHNLNKIRMQEQWDKINKAADLLKTNIQKCEIFISENYDKRIRYRQKIEQLHQKQQETDDNIKKMKESIVRLKDVRSLMEEKTKEYSFYGDYLGSVAMCDSWLFKNIDSIIQRRDALYAAREEAVKIQTKHIDRLTAMHEEIKRFLTEKHMTYIRLAATSNKLMGRFEEAKTTSLDSENIIYLIYSESIKVKSEFLAVRQTCWRLYTHMREKNLTKTNFKEEHVIQQLTVINRVLGNLNEILKKLHLH